MIPILLTATILHDGAVREVSTESEVCVLVGERFELRVGRSEGSNVAYTFAGLPVHASAVMFPWGIAVQYTPTESDVGTYDVAVSAGETDNIARRTVRLVIEPAGHAVMSPGAIASVFIPDASNVYGAFVGGGAELLLYSFVAPRSIWLPSHGRVFLDLEILGATHAGVDPMLLAPLGFDFNLETDPRRRFLIPFVGGMIGFGYQKQMAAFGFGGPLAGIYFWAVPNMRIAMSGGYLLPTTGGQENRGPYFTASIDIGPW